MLKLLIIFCLTLNKLSVESCSKSSPPERMRPPAIPGYISSELCANKVFKKYEKHGNFISDLADTKKIGELSLVGTHQSISHLLSDYNGNTKKQEINIMDQLYSGARFLDITLCIDSDILMVCTGNVLIGKTFGEVLYDVNTFLSYHKREVVMIKLSSQSDDTNADMCDMLSQYHDNNVGGLRLITNWNLNDTIGSRRGSILLVSEEKMFKKCTFSLKGCLRSNNNIDNVEMNTVDAYVDHEWSNFLTMVNNSFNDKYICNIYDLSIKDKDFPVKNVSKYGGNYVGIVNNEECVKPINLKIWKDYPKTNLKELNIIIIDYMMLEVSDRVNKDNV